MQCSLLRRKKANWIANWIPNRFVAGQAVNAQGALSFGLPAKNGCLARVCLLYRS
jgi:hypothetical protein